MRPNLRFCVAQQHILFKGLHYCIDTACGQATCTLLIVVLCDKALRHQPSLQSSAAPEAPPPQGKRACFMHRHFEGSHCGARKYHSSRNDKAPSNRTSFAASAVPSQQIRIMRRLTLSKHWNLKSCCAEPWHGFSIELLVAWAKYNRNNIML